MGGKIPDPRGDPKIPQIAFFSLNRQVTHTVDTVTIFWDQISYHLTNSVIWEHFGVFLPRFGVIWAKNGGQYIKSTGFKEK